MRILRNHIILSFGLIQPEMIIDYLKCIVSSSTHNDNSHFHNCIPDIFIFRHYALEYYRSLTYEEIDNMYYNMLQTIRERGKYCANAGTFALLPEYTLHVLSIDKNNPVCKQSEKLNWRSCYLQLGQDLLIAAHLAYIHSLQNISMDYFGWPSIIGTNDRHLNQIFDNGLAENHFHLNGSTRGFDLSWICLMNHPENINTFFSKKSDNDYEKYINNSFTENLSAGIYSGTADNRLSWSERLNVACYLRAVLFLWIHTGRFLCIEDNSYCNSSSSACRSANPFEFVIDIINRAIPTYGRKIQRFIDLIKFQYGQCGKILQPNKKLKCLDYAITADVFLKDNPCRALTGERAFLYKALCLIFTGRSNNEKYYGFKELFYLYILIKTQFRHEIIQTNGRYGFKNFAKYQDRKDILFEHYKEYELEAKNLSVNESIDKGNVKSLEMRITPADNLLGQYKKIKRTDDEIVFLRGEKHPRSSIQRKREGCKKPYFYVTHFPKLPEKNNKHQWCTEYSRFSVHPRNYTVRNNSKKQAKAMAKMLERYNWTCTRLRGFDACTFEIACRPEVFATEFRFLRNFSCGGYRSSINNIIQPLLFATYHVGEDFLDLIDGLRAIDEAALFLELKSGERMGHALALGVDVKKYYQLKSHCIVMSKQDLLDNIVWALNKAKILNIDLRNSFRQKLMDKAIKLLYEIYGADITVYDYYDSWKLRGDDPFLYRFDCFDEELYYSPIKDNFYNISFQYNHSRIRDSFHPEKFLNLRKNYKITHLYFLYHYDLKVRRIGELCEDVEICDDYIRLAEDIQLGMQKEIAEKHIYIECNPSSNILIGPFDRYEQHPIFTFYPVRSIIGNKPLFVSVNTDDQGVFDTSLEEEFSLLECALRKKTSSSYCDDEIYGYLEKLQKNGFSQIFPRTSHRSEEIAKFNHYLQDTDYN